jgi:hypothetical protein
MTRLDEQLNDPCPNDVILSRNRPMDGFISCELGPACIACSGMNMAMALFIRTCQLHNGWVPVGRIELIVLARSQVAGIEPERSWVESTAWIDFHGLVDKRVLEWHVGQQTGEQFLGITRFGLGRVREWVTENGAVDPISSMMLQ